MALPGYLSTRDQWITWNLIAGRKVPLHPLTGKAFQVGKDEPLPLSKVPRRRAVVLGSGLCGLDLDDCMEPTGAPKEWARRILDAFAGCYAEISPSGEGIKVFFVGNVARAQYWQTTDGGSLELYGSRRFFTVTESEIQAGGEGIVEDPARLILEALGEFAAESSRGSDGTLFDSTPEEALALRAVPSVPLDVLVERFLPWIDGYNHYPRWVEIGMALKTSYGEDGFAPWCDWSAKSPKFDPEQAREKWDTFPATSRLTAGTVVRAGREGVSRRVRQLQLTLMRLDTAEGMQALLDRVKLPISPELGASIQKTADQRLISLGLQPTVLYIPSMSDETPPDVVGTDDQVVERNTFLQPFWDRIDGANQAAFKHLKPYVWFGQGYYRLPSPNWIGMSLSVEGFRIAVQSHMPIAARSGRPIDPHVLMRERLRPPVVNGVGYCPQTDELIYQDPMTQSVLVNQYRRPVEAIDPDGRQESALDEFFLMAYPWEEERSVLLSWLAAGLISNPDRYIPRPLWMVILYGAPGIGKSWLMDMMVRCYGPGGALSLPGEDIVGSSFTSWEYPRGLCCLEELYSPEHRRTEIANRLKPQITNATVSVHLKGKTPYQVSNYMAWMAATNHIDSIAIGQDDRRYAIFESPIGQQDWNRWGRGAELFQLPPGVFRAWMMEHFRPNLLTSVPRTRATRRAMKVTLPETDAAVEACLEGREEIEVGELLLMVEATYRKITVNRLGYVVERLGWELRGGRVVKKKIDN